MLQRSVLQQFVVKKSVVKQIFVSQAVTITLRSRYELSQQKP
jgi:hypothetical protein